MEDDLRLSHDHLEVDRLLAEAIALIGSDREIFPIVDLIWARLAVHIRAEHLHLFPAIRAIAEQFGDSSTIDIIASLKADHDILMKQFASVIKALRSGSSQDVRKTLTSIAHRLAVHNEVEENEIYPLVHKWIGDAKRGDLLRRIAGELANVPSRFHGTRWTGPA